MLDSCHDKIDMTDSTCRNQHFHSGSLSPMEGEPPPEQCDALEACPMPLEEARS
jgi:hypothetical protein